MYVVDASVWVSRFLPGDAFHAESRHWVEERVRRGEALVIPTLALVEVAGAVARRTGRASNGRRAAQYVEELSVSHPVALDENLARLSALVAATFSLRGADAVYVAVARGLDSPLVTWDKEQLERGAPLVETLSPGADPAPTRS